MTDGQDDDLDRPNAARIYDYLLGGAQNFTADRAAAEHVLASTSSIVFPRFAWLYEETAHPLNFRPRDVVESFCAGFALVESGLVYVSAWRPDSADDPLRDEPGRAPNWASVGRKP